MPGPYFIFKVLVMTLYLDFMATYSLDSTEFSLLYS
jgi:hypothetical protein